MVMTMISGMMLAEQLDVAWIDWQVGCGICGCTLMCNIANVPIGQCANIGLIQ